MIEVKNLTKKYGNHVAVNDISFTVEKGCIYGFLGPNGAGKSTTMNIMTGYIGATYGEVIINGVNILEEPEKAKKSIGYLPELPPLYLDMTVTEYLRFVAELKQIPGKEIKEEVAKVCELIALEEVENRIIKNLSKGFKQRVGLAGAVMGFPEIIILDEPMVGLDPKQIIEIRELIKELSKEHTIIISSHILAEIKEICDHVIIISKGCVVASDTPENLETVVYGGEVIELVVPETEQSAMQIIEKVEGVKEVELTRDEGKLTFGIVVSGDSVALCEAISVALVGAGIPIRKLNTIKASLEDIFLELTTNLDEDDEDEEEKESDEFDEEIEEEEE